MMITIHGFPAKTKYQDVKILVKQECNISDFILDNLVTDSDGSKKVRIGLTDNSEGYRLMKCLDGYRMPGNFVLKAVPVGKAAASLSQPGAFDSQPSYQNQPRNEYSNPPRNDYIRQPTNDYSNQGSHGVSHGHGGPHGPVGPHGTGGSHGPRASHTQSGPHGQQGAMESMNRPSPWASGSNNPNQWNSNPPMAAQVPQNSFGFNSPQTMNPSFGHQHQGHPRTETRPGFNQGRAPDQGYGFPPKGNIPEVPANSRYKWTRIKKTEPELWNLPNEDEDCPSSSSSDSSDDDPTSKDTGDKDIGQSTMLTNTGEPGNKLDRPLSKKARKKKENAWRNINNLSPALKKRLFWWLKRGKTFKEARELCENTIKKCPEYAAAKEYRKTKLKERALRKVTPQAKAVALKLEQLKGPPAIATGPPIRVRIIDELGVMSTEKLDKLQDKILELIEAEVEENRPTILTCAPRFGNLFLTCADDKSVEWLRPCVNNIQLWEGARLNVINLNEAPKTLIGVAFVPNPNLDEDGLFTMLKSQNPDLDLTHWWINHRKIVNSDGQTVTFSLGENSIPYLAERNYNVYLGFKKIKIKIKSKMFAAGIGQIGSAPSTSTSASAMFPPPGHYSQPRPFVGGNRAKQNYNPGGYAGNPGNRKNNKSKPRNRPGRPGFPNRGPNAANNNRESDQEPPFYMM